MRLQFTLSALCAVFFLCASNVAAGQSVVTGTIVYGNQFKTVPGIEVHLVNKSLKPVVDRKQITDDDGGYLFEDVPPGTGYTVDVYDNTGKIAGTDAPITVLAGQPHSAVPNIDISRGLTAERAAKAGGLVENDRGISPGANVSNEQLRVLPLYNRNFLALGLLQPGVHDVEQGSPLQGAGFSIAGSPSSSTNFLLDGVDNVASSSNQAIPFQVNEAVREFRIVYATPSMKYGQGSGGVVDVITSSGDIGTGTAKVNKAFHGHLFGYFNNDALNANAPLSVYSNSGFSTAAAYAGGANATSAVISASGAQGTTCVGEASPFCGYSPQSYNALFNLFGSSLQNYGIDTGCLSKLCNAGAFNPSAILATQDSHLQPISSKQFGGSVGGPIGDHLFAFGSYEGTLIENPTPIFERVPTSFDTNISSFPGLNPADSGISQSVLKLFPAPNIGQTGSSTISNGGTGVLGFYKGQAPNYTHVHNVTLRPDLLLDKYGSVSFRYTGQLLDQLHDDTLPSGSAYPGNGAFRRAQNQSAAAIHNFQFGGNLNILSLGFTQYRVDEVAQDRGFNLQGLGSSGGVPTIVLSGIDPQTSAATPGKQGAVGGWYDSFWQACPEVPGAMMTSCPTTNSAGNSARSPSAITPSLDGQFPLARIGAPLSAPSKRRDTEAFVSDVLALRLGSRNMLNVGGDFRYQQNFSYDGGSARGLIVSNNIGEFTHDSETCVSCGNAFSHPSFDYELKQPTGYYGDLRSSNFGVFAENTFKANPNLTLTAGIRYEYFGQQLDSQNRMWNFNAANSGLSRQGATGTFDAFNYQCGGGTTFFDAVYGSLRASTPRSSWNCNSAGTFQLPKDKKNFTALFGFSFSPDGGYKHLFRASIGGYYDHLPASYNQKLLLNRPSPYNVNNPSAIYGQNFASSYASTQCQQGTSCAFGLSSLSDPGSPVFQNYQAASAATILYERDPKALHTPYLVQYSLGYQHSFSGSWSGEVNYTNSLGRRLPLVYDGNFANEFYCTQSKACNNNTYFPVFTESNIGISYYTSLVVRLESRAWHGLSLHAAYTLGRSEDNVAGGQFPQATDSLWTQLFGRQLYGAGNPAVFALQANSAGYGSNGTRGGQLNGPPNSPGDMFRRSLLQSANIPSFDAVQSALTTTGSRVVNVSHYSLPQNPLAFSSAGAQHGVDYGPSDSDVRHRFVADFVYDIPSFGHNLLKGFLVSGVSVVQSGQPFSIFSGPAYGQVTQLSNVPRDGITKTGNPAAYISGVSASSLLGSDNAACPQIYAQPTLYSGTGTAPVTPAACVGSGQRNGFNGPGYFSQDLALQKLTKVPGRDGQNFTIRAEFYNVFNRSNFYNPISELSSDGVHLNPLFGQIRSAHDPFQLQLAVRYDF